MFRDASQFAQSIFQEMARLRGWKPETVPPEVRDDIFATLNRHNDLYCSGFASGQHAKILAQQIQLLEWER